MTTVDPRLREALAAMVAACYAAHARVLRPGDGVVGVVARKYEQAHFGFQVLVIVALITYLVVPPASAVPAVLAWWLRAQRERLERDLRSGLTAAHEEAIRLQLLWQATIPETVDDAGYVQLQRLANMKDHVHTEAFLRELRDAARLPSLGGWALVEMARYERPFAA